MKIKNALIVHESSLMGKGIEATLRQHFHSRVIYCDSAVEGLRHMKTSAKDLLICSYDAPKQGALELIKRCKTYSSDTKIMVCAREINLLAAEKCFENGANAYVTANISESELIDGITKIHLGMLFTETTVTNALAMNRIQGDKPILAKLSAREVDILVKVARDIPVSLVAKELFLAEKTVANYVSVIKKKLNVKSSAGLLEIALKEGIIELTAAETQPVFSSI